MEEGTHESLLTISDGVYNNLVHAQHLQMDQTDDSALSRESTVQAAHDSNAVFEKTDKISDDIEKGIAVPGYKKKGIFNSIGILFFEQRKYWMWYTFAAIGILGAGGK